jgi:hypothetical protein
MPRRVRTADILYDIMQEIYASALRLNCPNNFASLFYDPTVEFIGNKLGINWLKQYRTLK